MPPIRRKKKGEDSSSESSQSSKPIPKSTLLSKPTSSRTNPMGNKAARPAKTRMSPQKQEAPKPTAKAPISRQNTNKPAVKKPASKAPAVVQEPKRVPTPVSPVSPVAHEFNQISRREITPPSRDESESDQEQPDASDDTRAMAVRTPTSTMKRSVVPRKISRFEKDRIIENIKYEVERRAKALRQRNALQADMLRQSIELRVGRIPYKMRNISMGELYDQSVAIATSTTEKENRLEAQRTVKELEGVRQMSNPPNGDQLKVSKKRAVSPAPIKRIQQTTSAIPLRSPVTTTAQLIQPSNPSPVKPTFTQKTVASIKSKLVSKKPATTTANSRTTTKATAASAAATAAVAKAAKTTKTTKAKTTTTTTTGTKTTGRALRSRK